MSSRRALPLKLSPKARSDFVDILRYTGETWGQQQLATYKDKIDNALQAISRNALSFAARHDGLPCLTALASPSRPRSNASRTSKSC